MQHGRVVGAEGVHVHVLIARVELNSGLAFNPAPPGWRRDFDHVRDAWNWQQGWARPDDPQRARLVQPPAHDHFRAAAELRSGVATAIDPRTEITAWLADQVTAGLVTDRPSLLAVLGEHFEVTRTGANYVSVRLGAGAKPIRLKGALYDQHFTTDTGGDAARGGGVDRPVAREGASSGRGRSGGADAGGGEPACLDEPADAGRARRARERAWTRRVGDELNTTQLAIASDLTRIRRSVRSVSNARWRWTMWPPIASILFSVLMLLVADLISGSQL